MAGQTAARRERAESAMPVLQRLPRACHYLRAAPWPDASGAALKVPPSAKHYTRLNTNHSQRSQHLKPNYQFEKRQRELEKKKKKALKTLKKGGAVEPAADVAGNAAPAKTEPTG
jgi:hypothetical protein